MRYNLLILLYYMIFYLLYKHNCVTKRNIVTFLVLLKVNNDE